MENSPHAQVDERAAESLSREQVRDTLRSVALFQGLGGADLERILGISESVLVEAGEWVFEEGDRGDHFFIIVQGQIELRKKAADGDRKLAVLRAGQAFGEMALLNQTPRSASALALENTYMLSVSRAAFGQILGGDTLAVRLLRNLSRALWATSVRLAAQQQTQTAAPEPPHEALADFNRLLRSRLLPRVTPRVNGYDLTASTVAPRQGAGSTAWDWIVLDDGRPAFVVMRATHADIFAAHRLAALRALLRALSDEPQPSLGALLTKASSGLRSGWIEGLSGAVACAVVALEDGVAEVASAGDACALLLRAGGDTRDLSAGMPPAGERVDPAYESESVELGSGDKIVLLSHAPTNVAGLVTSVVTQGYTSSSRDALNKLLARLGSEDGTRGATDLTGAVITRVKSA